MLWSERLLVVQRFDLTADSELDLVPLVVGLFVPTSV